MQTVLCYIEDCTNEVVTSVLGEVSGGGVRKLLSPGLVRSETKKTNSGKIASGRCLRSRGRMVPVGLAPVGLIYMTFGISSGKAY